MRYSELARRLAGRAVFMAFVGFCVCCGFAMLIGIVSVALDLDWLERLDVALPQGELALAVIITAVGGIVICLAGLDPDRLNHKTAGPNTASEEDTDVGK